MTTMSFPEDTYFEEKFAALSMADEAVTSKTFEDCVFDGCSFINIKFVNCKFINCKFNDCILSAVVPMNCRFIEAEFNHCKTMGIDWTKTQLIRDLKFTDSQLNFSNFRMLKMPLIKITNCEVKESDFTEADLSKGEFKNTDFEKTRFFKTNLAGADFKSARNYTIDIQNNTIKKAKFSYPEALSLLNSLDIIIE
jgi:fluoroquinolone resistance protein